MTNKPHKIISIRYTVITLLLYLPVALMAQDEWGEGEVQDAEVVIEKERKISLPFANRRFGKVPPLELEPPEYELVYDVLPIHYTGGAVNPRVRVLTIQEERLSKIHGNYLKAGFGNYLTPYFALSLANRRQAEYNYGVQATHLSSGRGPVDDKNSASSYNKIKLYGNTFAKALKLGGNIDYRRDGYYFYGYDQNLEVDRDTIKQVLNHISLNGYVASSDPDAYVKFRLNGSYDYIADLHEAGEGDFMMRFFTDYQASDNVVIGGDADISFLTRNDISIDKQNRSLFRGSPFIEYSVEDLLHLHLGVNLAYEYDTTGNLRFYPDIRGSYNIAESARLYAGIRGNLEKRSYRTFIRENQFLAPNIPLHHLNNTFEFYGGIRGMFSSRSGYEAGISTANYRNMGYFINDFTDTTKFTLVYEKGISSVFNAFASLTFSESEKFSLNFRGDYYAYRLDSLPEPWHKPSWKLTLNSNTNIVNKIYLNIDTYLMGGIAAMNPPDGQFVSLDPIIDLNTEVEYLVSDQFSIFLGFNNMLGQNYQRYLNYPVKGLQVMGGLTYTF